jgi:predicted O-methyltransferase YrrM
MQTLLPRPVTPITILAQHLDDLRERAVALAYDEPAFAALLDESARLAAGLEAYLDACTSPESDVRAQLAAETARHDWAHLHADGRTAIPLEMEMLSGNVEGQLLNFLVRATRATRILEIVVGSTLLEPHGLICVDNTLMQGQPYLSETRTPNGQAIYEFNRLVANDARIEQVLVPIRDGLTLIRRAQP